VKQYLLIGDRTVNEALNQALKLEAAKVAAEPPAKLLELTGALARASQPSDPQRKGLCAGSADLLVTCTEIARRDHVKRETRAQEMINASENGSPLVSPTSTPQFTLNILGQGSHDSLIAKGWVQGKPYWVTINTALQ
jgi:hypothetical protein